MPPGQNSAVQHGAVSQHKQLLPIGTVPCAERNVVCSAVPANSMERSPFWEANRSSASQEILHILRNLKVHYRIHKSPSTVPILSQVNHAHFLKSHFNIFSSLSLNLSCGLFPSGFSTKLCLHPSSLALSLSLTLSTFPAQIIVLELITQLIFGEKYGT